MPLSESNRQILRDLVNTHGRSPSTSGLSLAEMGLDNTDMDFVKEIIAQLPFLTLLDLQGNYITAAGLHVLLPLPSSIITLNLNNNCIGDEGAAILATLYVENILIRGNRLGPEGARHFVDHPWLSVLDISENPIKDAGVNLAGNRELSELDISGTELSEEVAQHLLNQKICLSDLILDENENVADETVGRIEFLVRTRRAEREQRLQIESEEWSPINHHLRRKNFRHSLIGVLSLAGESASGVPRYQCGFWRLPPKILQSVFKFLPDPPKQADQLLLQRVR